MPQISLYIDKETLGKVEKAANKEHLSVSKWVGINLRKIIKESYPAGYFELFGSITDESFKAPEKKSFKNDIRREKF